MGRLSGDLRRSHFHYLVHRCLQAIGILAASLCKMRLTATATLNETAGFAHHLARILAFLGEILRKRHRERRLSF